MSDAPDIIVQGPLPDEVPPAPAEEAKPAGDDRPTQDAGKQDPGPDEDAEDEDESEGDDQPKDDPGKRKRPGKYQRTVTRLEGELRELRMALMTRENGSSEPAKQAAPQPAPDAPPKAEDFQDYEDYLVARAAHKLRQEQAQQQQQAAQQAQRRQQAEAADAFRERVEAATEKFPDFHEVAFSPKVPITTAMAETIASSEMGADLAYHLGKNIDEAKRIAALAPIAQVRELGKLEAKLSAPPTPLKTTQAPKPPKTVTGAAGAAENPNGMSYAEYVAWRRRK